VIAALLALHWPIGSGVRVTARFVAMGLLLVSPYLAWVQMYEGLGVHVSEARRRSQREFEKADWERPVFNLDRTRPLTGSIVQGPIVDVRWVAGLPDPYRTARERALSLEPMEPSGPQTWRYHAQRWTSSGLRSIVEDPTVAATEGIDRAAFHATGRGPGVYLQPLAWLPIPGEGVRTVGNGVAILYYVEWLLPVLAALLACVNWSRMTPPSRMLVVSAVGVQLLMNWFMLRDPLVTRVRDVIAPMAILLPFVAARAWEWPPSRGVRIAVRVAIAGSLAVVLWAAAAAGNLSEEVDNAKLLYGWDAMNERYDRVHADFAPPYERTGRVRLPIVDYLRDCSAPTARLFTMTFAPELFFYTGRGFAGGHESILPGMEDTPRQMSLMLDRLQHEDVPFVILDSETEGEMPAAYPPVSAYVHRHYREVARYTVSGEKQWAVLAAMDRVAAGTYRDGALPCFTKD